MMATKAWATNQPVPHPCKDWLLEQGWQQVPVIRLGEAHLEWRKFFGCQGWRYLSAFAAFNLAALALCRGVPDDSDDR